MFVKRLLTAPALITLPGIAFAASFQILEQSPAHLGKAFAGTASDISDASSVFFNPAGISELDASTITVGANAIFTQAEFNDTDSNTGGAEGKTDETGYVPNVYWVTPINERTTFGLGINAPYGLASDYDDDWIGRYLATHSELEVVNVNAVFAYDVTDNFSVGVGLDYQRAEVTLESRIDSTFGINPSPANDSSAKIQGDDDDFTADLSVYFKPTDDTRMGITWRQGGKFDLEGSADFTLNALCSPGAGFATGAPPAPTTGTLCAAGLTALEGDARAKVQLPDTVTLSASHNLDNHWRVHGDIAWTNWSNIQTISIINSDNNQTINQLNLQYEDSMRYALGFSYESESPWTWRAGIAWDESPQTDPTLLSPRIPDQDRTWFSTGFNYELNPNTSMDVGYTYIKVDKAWINNTDTQTGHHVEGSFDADVHIVGVQGNWRF